MIKRKNFNFNNYFFLLKEKISSDKFLLVKLQELRKGILNCKKNKNKVIIFGNGGSASIASHFALDLTNAGKVRCVNFSDSSLITCFSNDYGFDNWIYKALDFYADKGDLLILISSRGRSKNMINAVKKSKVKFSSIVTFTGFDKKNELKKIGKLSFHVNSNVYNIVENIHQIWLLSIIDSLIKNK